MSTTSDYYLFVKRNLEVTKICTKKCQVLENKTHDYLEKAETDCMAKCAYGLLDYQKAKKVQSDFRPLIFGEVKE